MSLIKRLVLHLFPLFADAAQEVVITTPEGDEIVVAYIRPNRDVLGAIKVGISADQKFKISRRKPTPQAQADAKERDAEASRKYSERSWRKA